MTNPALHDCLPSVNRPAGEPGSVLKCGLLQDAGAGPKPPPSRQAPKWHQRLILTTPFHSFINVARTPLKSRSSLPCSGLDVYTGAPGFAAVGKGLSSLLLRRDAWPAAWPRSRRAAAASSAHRLCALTKRSSPFGDPSKTDDPASVGKWGRGRGRQRRTWLPSLTHPPEANAPPPHLHPAWTRLCTTRPSAQKGQQEFLVLSVCPSRPSALNDSELVIAKRSPEQRALRGSQTCQETTPSRLQTGGMPPAAVSPGSLCA